MKEKPLKKIILQEKINLNNLLEDEILEKLAAIKLRMKASEFVNSDIALDGGVINITLTQVDSIEVESLKVTKLEDIETQKNTLDEAESRKTSLEERVTKLEEVMTE